MTEANIPCFECHNRYGHKATCSKYLREIAEIDFGIQAEWAAAPLVQIIKLAEFGDVEAIEELERRKALKS